MTELTIIEDYEHHVQYVIDAYDGNCTVSTMPHGLAHSIEKDGEISMRHGAQLLNFGKQTFKFQGQRWYRDMKVIKSILVAASELENSTKILIAIYF